MNPRSGDRGGARHIAIDARMAGDSGIGTYISNLVPRIIAARPDWRFTLLARAGASAAGTWAGLPNVAVRACRSRVHSIGEQLELLALTPGDADLFWAPNFNIPLARRGRLVVTVHDVAHLELAEFVNAPLKHAYAQRMFAAVGRRATEILCVSDFTRGALLRRVRTVDREPTVTPLGVGPEWNAPRPLERPHPRPYAVYVGNVKPHKNLATLVSGFAAIAGDVPHDLVIVGRREGMRTVDEAVQASAAAAGDRILFAGEVSSEALRSYVGWADALVMPSLYEGFGLPPLEAMAAGCPVLVSRAGALPETCGDAALYCDPLRVDDVATQLRWILTDAMLQARLRDLGRQHVRAFTWERCARSTLTVLERAVGGEAPDRSENRSWSH